MARKGANAKPKVCNTTPILSILAWVNQWCLMPEFCIVRLYWAGYNLGLWVEFCCDSCLGTGSIARPVDQQSSVLPLYYGRLRLRKHLCNVRLYLAGDNLDFWKYRINPLSFVILPLWHRWTLWSCYRPNIYNTVLQQNSTICIIFQKIPVCAGIASPLVAKTTAWSCGAR